MSEAERSHAEQALQVWAENGEKAMLRHLAERIHPLQPPDGWDEAGIAILEDNSSVIRADDAYLFRWGRNGPDEQAVVPSDMMKAEHPLPTLRTGPIYHSPDVQDLWNAIDEKLAGRARDRRREEGEDYEDDDDPFDTGLTMQDALEGCPELADAVAEVLQQNGELPETVRERIRLDVMDLADLVLERLDEDAADRLVKAATRSIYGGEGQLTEGTETIG